MSQNTMSTQTWGGKCPRTGVYLNDYDINCSRVACAVGVHVVSWVTLGVESDLRNQFAPYSAVMNSYFSEACLHLFIETGWHDATVSHSPTDWSAASLLGSPLLLASGPTGHAGCIKSTTRPSQTKSVSWNRGGGHRRWETHGPDTDVRTVSLLTPMKRELTGTLERFYCPLTRATHLSTMQMRVDEEDLLYATRPWRDQWGTPIASFARGSKIVMVMVVIHGYDMLPQKPIITRAKGTPELFLNMISQQK